MIFANVEVATEELDALIEASDPPASAVVISAEAATHIDVTAIDALASYRADLNDRGVTLVVARLKADVQDQLEQAGTMLSIVTRAYLEVDEAVEAFNAGHLGGSSGTDAD